MQYREYRTTWNGQRFDCRARTKSEARQIFKQMTAVQVGANKLGGKIFAVSSRLRSKVRLSKEA
jgi:hypothetical protein